MRVIDKNQQKYSYNSKKKTLSYTCYHVSQRDICILQYFKNNLDIKILYGMQNKIRMRTAFSRMKYYMHLFDSISDE